MPSLLEALEQKYGESSTDSDGSEDEGISVAIFVPEKSPRTIVPSLLVLNDCDIATAGEKEALQAKCSCVEELDLAKNKLNDWLQVFEILRLMPRLKFVNLSFNPLSTPLAISDDSIRWSQLRSLVLNSTYIDWRSVRNMLRLLPGLEELHLSLNDYDAVKMCSECCACVHPADYEAEETGAKQTRRSSNNNNSNVLRAPIRHEGIRKLHFTGNPIADWSEICKLGQAFPSLEALIVAECPIRSLQVPSSPPKSHQPSQTHASTVGGDQSFANRTATSNTSTSSTSSMTSSSTTTSCQCERGLRCIEAPHDSFKRLKVLNLNATELATWDDIDKLAKFPALSCVRVQGCPLWESSEYTEHERRQLLIARLPNVKMLNGGGVIGHDEREDAERAFIRYYMDKPESERPERYFDLVSIHGKLDPLVNVDLRPAKRVKVAFTCGNNTEIRSVDVYRSVSDLKVKLEAFAGFSAAKMRLFYVDQDLRDIQGPEEMKYPHKQLYSYNIRSGDEIIIDSKRCVKPIDSSGTTTTTTTVK